MIQILKKTKDYSKKLLEIKIQQLFSKLSSKIIIYIYIHIVNYWKEKLGEKTLVIAL